MKVRWNHEKYGLPPLNLTKGKWYEPLLKQSNTLGFYDDNNEVHCSDWKYFIEQPEQVKHFECEYGDEHQQSKRYSIEISDRGNKYNLYINPNHYTSCKWVKLKENTEMKEEFKIDKLGWYSGVDCPSDGNSKFDDFEVIFIDEITKMVAARNKTKTSLFLFNLKGNCVEDLNWQLYKYLGSELPKEPRKFEFEGYLAENIFGETTELDDTLSINNVLKTNCSTFHRLNNFHEDYKISKWKINMEEIIE